MSDPNDLFARELEGVLKKYYALKEARQRHPYVGDLIRVLLPYPEGVRRALVIFELEKQRRQDRLPIPATFKAAVQSSYNHYSQDSEMFKKRGAPSGEGLFYSPTGKGSGRWAVHPERALAWLKTKLGEPRLL
ncbi:MAG TPA: hypothetical protein VH019_03330 [Rhizomicrobium sp.]|jgi:hypothetical protein|nr:hypothetical protein [Rhizomicrobium sp.]